ncbi:atherin-like [Cygnus olor]|uniref:atherin-like n=1 Tax=Cygnus olor TaxID=8869 RepID=UPI001ADEBA8E|nr:atherin-like [Cygnus olor]
MKTGGHRGSPQNPESSPAPPGGLPAADTPDGSGAAHPPNPHHHNPAAYLAAAGALPQAAGAAPAAPSTAPPRGGQRPGRRDIRAGRCEGSRRPPAGRQLGHRPPVGGGQAEAGGDARSIADRAGRKRASAAPLLTADREWGGGSRKEGEVGARAGRLAPSARHGTARLGSARLGSAGTGEARRQRGEAAPPARGGRGRSPRVGAEERMEAKSVPTGRRGAPRRLPASPGGGGACFPELGTSPSAFSCTL